ncbi:major facilitator superfamily domain-containing protein [Cercophora newfieldiana]|uniref:Major facilitator superfamily domain-containing protein n=1 Tax=Cercophora newfieldiana TaxID=92897 RepID=A0AA39XWX8_9PEZI|nr:major facilitator superfamily domain-containing protein [Cercophora newfieldiana]
MVTASGSPRSATPPGNGVDTVGSGDSNGNGERRSTLETEPTESTTLLGGSSEDGSAAPRKDSWVGYEDFEGLSWWKTPSVWWMMVPYAFFTLAFGGSLVPKLNLIIDLICKKYFDDKLAADPRYIFHPVVPGGDNPHCRQDGNVLQNVATFTLVLNVLVGGLSTLTAPKIGALSDRFGRKRLIVVSSSGAIIGEIITILAATYPNVVHYRWLLFGSICDGLAGSFTAGSILSHAYVADCTPPSKRSVAIGYLHSCLFTGLAFGPLLAGYLVEWTGSLLSIFYVTLGCHIFFILFMFFIAPESLSKRRQRIARDRHAREREAAGPPPAWALFVASYMPFGKHFGDTVRAIISENPLAPLSILFPSAQTSTSTWETSPVQDFSPIQKNKRLRRNLITFAFIDMWILGAAMSAGTVMVLYTEKMFNWGNFESSRFISLISMVRVVVLMGIFPVINYIFRTRRARRLSTPVVETNAGADELDIWILRTALVSDVIGALGYVFARNSGEFVLAAIITAFGGMGSATIQAALSKHVPAERVGQLLGGIGLLHSLARVFSPIVFNGLFAATVKTFPEAFFVLLLAVFVLCLAASFLVRPHGMLPLSACVFVAINADFVDSLYGGRRGPRTAIASVRERVRRSKAGCVGRR